MKETAHIKVKSIIQMVLIIAIILVGTSVISKYNYNDFDKGVREKGITKFSRDNQVKYSKNKSYKVENIDYNDAVFSKKITVKPNTAYKVTCMIKTENVENKNGIYTGGAQIAIKNSLECSESVTGTTDWTKTTLMFNSKNREEVEIGFRLGGYAEDSKGTAWFADLKIEEGNLDEDKNWNMACFLIENLNVNAKINGKQTNINLKLTDSDKKDIKANIQRLPNTFRELSNNQMTMTCDIFEIKDTLKTISYEDENEYFVDPGDVKNLIKKYVDQKEYDYIFVAVRLGNINSKNVLVHDWIGLGGMDYYGIGFSNIRLPDSENSYIYKYNSSVNTFPEEVFVHEFLHTLERNEKEYGNENLINLHDYEQYGYKTEHLISLKNWYKDYMQNTIKNTNGKRTGITQNGYWSKPIHESNFKYTYELNDLDEPQNIIEEINNLVNRAKKLFENRK